VLVVVEDGDTHLLLEPRLDVEALGTLDVLEVDAAERRLEALDDLAEHRGVLLVDLDVEDVDVRELLEEVALALHHRLARERADVAEAEHGRAVGDDGHEVAARRVAERVLGLLRDQEARRRDARRVREREVPLRDHRFGRRDRDLPGPVALVIRQRVALEVARHGVLAPLRREPMGETGEVSRARRAAGVPASRATRARQPRAGTRVREVTSTRRPSARRHRPCRRSRGR
jgi:hypothetical protein